jgi:hypothetical protein
MFTHVCSDIVTICIYNVTFADGEHVVAVYSLDRHERIGHIAGGVDDVLPFVERNLIGHVIAVEPSDRSYRSSAIYGFAITIEFLTL